MLSDIERYKTWFYGKRIEDPNSVNDGVKTIWNIGVSVMFGVFSAIISWWTIKMFLPNFNNIALILALLHGCIFAIPMLYYGNRFNF
jgi:predicted membrane protein